MNKVFIFPGQGSQIVGMGKDLYDNFAIAKETFEHVDDVLHYKLSDIIFNDPNNTLKMTINTQPALMVVSMAILNVIIQQSGKTINQLCSYVAGHSLGEYSALCAANSINLESTTKLLQIRASSMQEACHESGGAMAACIGMNIEELQKLINEHVKTGICQVANDNIKEQIVISGHIVNIDLIMSILKRQGYKAIKLNVSGAFHSKLMKSVEHQISNALEEICFNNPIIPVITNVRAKPIQDAIQIKNDLVMQICSCVRWRETLDQIKQLGITEIVEIGAAKVLTKMINKSKYPFATRSISSLNELESFMQLIT